MSQIVSIPAIPPREKSASIVALPVVDQVVRQRLVERLDLHEERSLVRLADERRDELRLGEPRQHAGEDGAAEDRQNGGTRRIQDDEQDQRREVEQRDRELLTLAAACAAAESKWARSPASASPRIVNRMMAMTTAGPDVQTIALMCSWVVTPPTMDVDQDRGLLETGSSCR